MELRHIESDHHVLLHDASGLPSGIGVVANNRARAVAFDLALDIEVGGGERRGSTGGIEYTSTDHLTVVAAAGEVTVQETPVGRAWRVPVSIRSVDSGAPDRVDLTADLLYRFNRLGPALSFAIDFVGTQPVVVRNLTVRGVLGLEPATWKVRAPGNAMASGVPLADISAAVGVSPIGGLRGSSATVHLEADHGPAMAVWFDTDVEIPEMDIRGSSKNSMAFTVATNFAADLSVTRSNEVQLLSVDLAVPSWAGFPERFSGWLRTRGLTSPGDVPGWVRGAMIYEAQIGFSVFNVTNRYSPYPEVDDLTRDLDRIRGLGFTVIQLMPRQPYPSYNIHDYFDVDISYGPKAMVQDLVDQCHRRGMRIIFDVLLHGVLDQESIGAAADGVRAGPYAARVTGETGDSFSTDVNDWDNYLVAWSRHILDFEPYWRAGSVPVSPLIAEHPDWFCRDSDGKVSGVYTKAFDVRNREWQEYFTKAMSYLLTELDIDGFRFDAPTYNDFPNWASWARGRAGSSALACVGLFERLRPVLKALKPDSLLYTEPSGHALRRSMDLNYNYDEQWLVTAVANPADAKPWAVHNAKGLATWMRDRDALLPAGSMTAHHIDSHDTFWWPTWGKKWRREQFAPSQFRLLTLIFAALPGPFMMFTGGEEGIADLLPIVADLKASPTWQRGTVSWWCGVGVPDSVFGVSRTFGAESITVLANFGAEPVTLASTVGAGEAGVRLSIGDGATFDADSTMLGPHAGVAFFHPSSL